MTDIRPSFRRILISIAFFMTFLLAVVKFASYQAIDSIDQEISMLIKSATNLPEAKAMAAETSLALYDLKFYVIPLSAAALFLFGILLGVFLRSFLSVQAPASHGPEKSEKSGDRKRTTEETDRKKHADRRLFLYWLSLLQREGRLLDFLFEDLDRYDDAQISASVRGIHERCRKVLQKKLSLSPIIDQEEGEEITVDSGFDSAAMVLTGNVVGAPPFRGILRHKGWQAKKMEIPVFSDAMEKNVIAPAEVEII